MFGRALAWLLSTEVIVTILAFGAIAYGATLAGWAGAFGVTSTVALAGWSQWSDERAKLNRSREQLSRYRQFYATAMTIIQESEDSRTQSAGKDLRWQLTAMHLDGFID